MASALPAKPTYSYTLPSRPTGDIYTSSPRQDEPEPVRGSKTYASPTRTAAATERDRERWRRSPPSAADARIQTQAQAPAEPVQYYDSQPQPPAQSQAILTTSIEAPLTRSSRLHNSTTQPLQQQQAHLTKSSSSSTFSSPSSTPDLLALAKYTETALSGYMTLRSQAYQFGNPDAAAKRERLLREAEGLSGEVRAVRKIVGRLAKSAEAHRWRKWVLGSALASFVPLVRRLFRRPSRHSHPGRSEEITPATNDTEYAFTRSRSLIKRIVDSSLPGTGTFGSWTKTGLTGLAFFVFAVLYVFQNEVQLRVARTLARKLKKLGGKIERGEEVREEDAKVLRGWRWRVLGWVG